MSDEEWRAEFAKVLGVILAGDSLAVTDCYGQVVRDETFLIFFNAHHENVPVRLPGDPEVRWKEILNTVAEDGFPAGTRPRKGGVRFALAARSLALFQQLAGSDEGARTPPVVGGRGPPAARPPPPPPPVVRPRAPRAPAPKPEGPAGGEAP